MTINKGELIGLDRPDRRRQDHGVQPADRRVQAHRRRVLAGRNRMNGKKTYQVVRAGIARTFRTSACSSSSPSRRTCLSPSMSRSPWAAPSSAPRASGSRRTDAREGRPAAHLQPRGLATTRAANLPYGQQRKLEIARARHRHETAAARRAGRRHEPHRNRDLLHCINDPRPFRYRHPAHRT